MYYYHLYIVHPQDTLFTTQPTIPHLLINFQLIWGPDKWRSPVDAIHKEKRQDNEFYLPEQTEDTQLCGIG